MEHVDHPSPQIKDGKMARFSLRATSSLIFFGGGSRGVSVPCYSVRDCSSQCAFQETSTLQKSNADLNECNNSNNINKIKLQTVDPAISKTQEAQADCARERKVH